MTRADRIAMWALIFCAFGFWIVFAQLSQGQTKPRPDQIQDWRQVAPPGAVPTGTQLRLDQLAIDPAWIAVWVELIRAGGYDHYRVAVDAGQKNPVLITCPRPETDPLGPGCVGGLFWFTAAKRNGLGGL